MVLKIFNKYGRIICKHCKHDLGTWNATDHGIVFKEISYDD